MEAYPVNGDERKTATHSTFTPAFPSTDSLDSNIPTAITDNTHTIGSLQNPSAFHTALPGSNDASYLRQRGIPLPLAQQLGVGYAAPGTWPHAARDWRGGRVVFPHTMPDGRLVNLYGRTVGRAEQVPKATRHDHLPGKKGYFNAASLHGGDGPLSVCEGAFDALALLAAGVPRVMAIHGVQGWRWGWVKDVCAMVFALDADTAGQQQWQALARQAVLRSKQVAVLPPHAYGGCKDVSEAWTAGVLYLDGGAADLEGTRGHRVPQEHQETWTEPVAIMVVDGGLPPAEAARCAWVGDPAPGATAATHSQVARGTARRAQGLDRTSRLG